VTRRSLALLAVVLGLGYAWLTPGSLEINNPNENVRIYMVRAIAEEHTYAIAGRTCLGPRACRDRGLVYDQWGYVNDKAIRCLDGGKGPDCSGALYAGKAPGISFLGVLPHIAQRGLWRLVGWGEPSKLAVIGWLRWWCVVLPSILGWLWLATHLGRTLRRPEYGLAVVLMGALGSLSLTYGMMFAGHQLAGLCLLAGVAGVVQRRPWLVGLGLGWAMCVEYTAAPAAVVVAGWFLVQAVRERATTPVWRPLALAVLGSLLPLGLLAHFHAVAFGAPWHLPYAHLENPGFVQDIAPGFMGIHLPNAEKTWGSLLSPFTGLWFWAPWTALFVLGLAARRRAEAVVGVVVVGYFLLFQCSHSLWRGGWVVGPRYITALVPFAALALAHGLDALPQRTARVAAVVTAVAGAVGVAATGLASAVSQGFPFEIYNPLPEVVGPLLAHGFVARNPLMSAGVQGPWSALPYFAALAVAIGWLVWLLVPGRAEVHARPSTRWLGSAAVLAVAGLWLAGLWQVGPGRTHETDRSLRFLMTTWTPAQPPGSRVPDGLPK
jgi:hypothetical protein